MAVPSPIVEEYLDQDVTNLRFEQVHFDTKFTGSRFSSVVFSKCRLDRVLMAKTNWLDCDFDRSTLVVHMNDAVFERCSFRNVVFKGLAWQYGGVRAKFVDCDFNGAQFNRALLRACKFVDCQLDEAQFIGCDLRGATHNGVELQNVS
jgi:uncharacterized protein YjbI with pentapeptide repeats